MAKRTHRRETEGSTMNSEMMHFRATPELADALAKAAEHEGVSQSEIIRRAVAGRVGCEKAPAQPVDPFELLARASRGELQAQRDLARMAVAAAVERDADGNLANDPLICLSEGLVFARLAATRGDIADNGLVLSILALFIDAGGEPGSAAAEGIARMELAASSAQSGSEQAAQMLTQLVADASPGVVALAGDYLRRIKEGAA
jgi:hypothetical protein